MCNLRSCSLVVERGKLRSAVEMRGKNPRKRLTKFSLGADAFVNVTVRVGVCAIPGALVADVTALLGACTKVGQGSIATYCTAADVQVTVYAGLRCSGPATTVTLATGECREIALGGAGLVSVSLTSINCLSPSSTTSASDGVETRRIESTHASRTSATISESAHASRLLGARRVDVAANPSGSRGSVKASKGIGPAGASGGTGATGPSGSSGTSGVSGAYGASGASGATGADSGIAADIARWRNLTLGESSVHSSPYRVPSCFANRLGRVFLRGGVTMSPVPNQGGNLVAILPLDASGECSCSPDDGGDVITSTTALAYPDHSNQNVFELCIVRLVISAFVLSDVNKDKIINETDTILIARSPYYSLDPAPSAPSLCPVASPESCGRADVNRDGRVNQLDITSVMQSAELGTPVPCGGVYASEFSCGSSRKAPLVPAVGISLDNIQYFSWSLGGKPCCRGPPLAPIQPCAGRNYAVRDEPPNLVACYLAADGVACAW